MSTDPNTPGTSGPAGGGTVGGDPAAGRPASPFGTAASTGDLARLPIPGNAEFLFWVAVVLLVGLIVLIQDEVNATDYVIAITAVSFAYLISRGIAKAGRVLEQ